MTDFLCELRRLGFSVSELAFSGAKHHAARDGRNYSIDAETGVLTPWPQTRVYTWYQVLAEFGGGPAVAAEAETVGPATSPADFLERCVAAGFVLDPPHFSPRGNRWGTWTNGRRYLLVPSYGEAIGWRAPASPLPAFVGPHARVSGAAAPKPGPAPARTRPPAAHTGHSAQRSLFAEVP